MKDFSSNSLQADEETGTKEEFSKAKPAIFAFSVLMTLATVAVFSSYAEPVDFALATRDLVVPEASNILTNKLLVGNVGLFETREREATMSGGVKNAPLSQAVPQQAVPKQAVPQQAVPQQTLPQQAVSQQTSPQQALAQNAVAQLAVVRLPQTQDGSSARNAAKSAVDDLQQFEQSRQVMQSSSGKDDSSQTSQPIVVSAGVHPSVAVSTAASITNEIDKNPVDTTTDAQTNDVSQSDSPNDLDVHHAEKSAAHESRAAIDDLDNFEKAVSTSKQQKTETVAVVSKDSLDGSVSASVPQLSQHDWGKKNYLLAKGVVTWLDSDHVGGKCDIEYERQQCGHMACHNATCQFCLEDNDCHSPRYRCYSASGYKEACKAGDAHCQCHHKLLWPMVGADVEAMILAFFATALAASGGIGGGGLLVPLFILVEDFEADLASPLSSATITGGAIVGYFLYCFRWHPLYPAVQRPLIDYETVLIILPSLLTGTMIGTIFDKILPLWFIMVMLFLLLGFSTFRTCKKGIQALESENVPDESQFESHCDCETTASGEKITGTRFPVHTLSLIVVFWFFVFSIALLKGGGYSQPSILPFITCNNHAYWILQVFCWVTMLGFFIFVRDQLINNPDPESGLDGDIVWTPTNSITLPLLCLPCGIFAGLLGVGGGMVVGPLLLELGARHSTVSATSTFTILVTASSSAAQFVLMGKLPPYYALFFAIIGGCGTFIGQMAVETIIRRFKSTSIIVFGISAVIFFSTVAMGYTGMRSVVRIVEVGGNMGLRNLCD